MISQCRWHWRIFAESVIHVHAFHKSAFLHVTLLSFLFNFCELMCRFLKLQTTKNRFKEISKFICTIFACPHFSSPGIKHMDRTQHLCARVVVFATFRSEDILFILTDFEPLRVARCVMISR